MALYRRGDTWHYDFTYEGRRLRGSTGLRDKKAAARVEDRERERARLGSDPRTSLALEDVADVWLRARVIGNRSAKDTARRMVTAQRLLGARTPITSIDSRHMADAIARRRAEPTLQSRRSHASEKKGDLRPPSNATVNRDLIDATLRPLLSYARKVLKLPVKEIDWVELRLPEAPPRVRSFSDLELAAYRAALPHWHQPIFDFSARYGVRLREAFFALEAFDAEGARVTLRQRKNGRPHTIPLLPEDARIMAAIAGRSRDAGLETLWFREMKDGTLEPIHWRGFQSACQKAVRTAGLVDARAVHDLRHHAGTAILRSTGNLQVARKLLGHEDIASTARYAHAYDADVLAGLRHASGTIEPKPKKKA